MTLLPAGKMTKHLAWNSMVVSAVAVFLCHLIGVFGEVHKDLKKDCLLYYDFEGASKQNVFDKSENKRFATMDNITRREGKCNKGIVFNEHPLRIDEPSFNKSSYKKVSSLEITVAAWIKLSESRQIKEEDRAIFTSFHARNGSAKNERKKFLYFRVSSMHTLRFSASFNVRCGRKKLAFKGVNETRLELGVWQHVAVSYNFKQGNERCTFFVNGIEFMGKPGKENLCNDEVSVYNPPFGRSPLIGDSDVHGDKTLNGMIDNFYIYNKTLSKEKIQGLMTCNGTTTARPKAKSLRERYKQQAEHIKNTTKAKALILKYVRNIIANASVDDNRTSSTISVTEDFESIVLTLARNTLKAGESETVETKTGETTALVLMRIPKAKTGFTFPIDEQQVDRKVNETISFPDEMAKAVNGDQRVFACMAYSKPLKNMPHEFTISSDPLNPNITVELFSKLIGAAVDPPLNQSLNNSVKITFTHVEITSGNLFCSFWNHSKRASDGKIGSWSTNGCERVEENATSTKTVCLCNHLTIFALFLQRNKAAVTVTTTATVTVTPTVTELVTVPSPVNYYEEKAKRIRNPTKAREFLSNNVEKIMFDVVKTPTPGSDDRTSGALSATKNIEDIVLTLTQNTLKVGQSATVDTSRALILMNIPLAGFTFPSDKQENVKKTSETISFPNEIVKSGNGAQRLFACMAYTDLHKNMPRNFTMSLDPLKTNVTMELFSKIIGAAVHPRLEKPLDLKNRVKIVFNHVKITSGQQVCSFWNHSERTSDGKIGSWSINGCVLDKETTTSTKTVCLCNHLTNFALLLQREGAPYNDPPISLKIITIIGSTLSILACFLCFVMFFTLKKKDIRHYLHINLAFAIAVAHLILLFGITETKYKILCKIMAACLHYFYMVAFLLMLSEGVHLAILIETAFSHGEMKLPIYLAASWGLPLIIVGITLGARYDNYGGSIACFISADDGTVYAFVGPFCLILLINFVILIMVLRQVIRKTSLPISSKSASKFEIARATVRSLVILFPVMGFTWIFGILFFGFRTLALEYLFAIFCSLQGFLIFLFQYALNTENRLAFTRATRRWRLTFTSSTNTSGNSTKPTTATTKKNISANDNDFDGDLNTSSLANCQLLTFRTVDDKNGGTIDSRTASTYI